MDSLPIIDVTSLRARGTHAVLVGDAQKIAVAKRIDEACRRHGFFLVTGHGIDLDLVTELESVAREFFALPDEEKSLIAMPTARSAWRGWFPLGGEVTSGVPDEKEGVYFGEEHPHDHPRVLHRTPLHGQNMFPERPARMRFLVLEYMKQLTALGHDLMSGIALGLGLDAQWFRENLTSDPTTLFRIFHYPPPSIASDSWGVGEHTDYGLLTMLWQDNTGGLEVFSEDRWLTVQPIPGAIVCNLGDMLERLTNLRYVSTPHRVINKTSLMRISMPFFFDPSWDARVVKLPLTPEVAPTRRRARWDGADPLAWSGTYGQYLTSKVSKAFPALFADLTRLNND